MKIFLIRHGEQQYPHDHQGRKLVSSPDAPLVELGRKQLQELGKALAKEGERLDVLYTSPILRARQSTDELAGVLSIAHIHVVDGLKEVFPNSAEGKTYDELEERGGDIYAHPFNGEQESLDHLVERSKGALDFIFSDAKRRGYNSVGIVGHGDPLCALDWALKNSDIPSSYDEMRKEFYPQKGVAYFYPISDDEPFRVVGEGRIITTEAAAQSIEGFRNPEREIQ